MITPTERLSLPTFQHHILQTVLETITKVLLAFPRTFLMMIQQRVLLDQKNLHLVIKVMVIFIIIIKHNFHLHHLILPWIEIFFRLNKANKEQPNFDLLKITWTTNFNVILDPPTSVENNSHYNSTSRRRNNKTRGSEKRKKNTAKKVLNAKNQEGETNLYKRVKTVQIFSCASATLKDR